MEIGISLPLDSDGFLRRECPHCSQQFKWHHGPASEEAEQHSPPPAYHCPLCGRPAGHESWYTQQQVAFIEAAAAPALAEAVDAEFDKLFHGLSSKYITVRRTGRLDSPGHPDPLTEPDDMVIVVAPCHSYEPVKVPDDRTTSLYCLVCGSGFIV